ncbi:NAD(P)/FAD-dependent oxidoreductase [Thermodesulfobacteriota bacterium]
MNKNIEADVLIIGGGVAGAAIARELSKYKIDTLLIEKSADVSMGISKTAHGYLYTGSEMVYSKILKSRGKKGGPNFDDSHSKSLIESFPIAHDLLHQLDVPHQHAGSVIITKTEKEFPLLEEIGKHAKEMHAFDKDAVRMIDQKTLREIEPNITPDAIGALYDPECILDMFPQEFVFALVDNAKENGVKMQMETEALGFSQENGTQVVKTNKGYIKTKFIINATGLSADSVADLAGARDDWEFTFTRHQIALYDKRLNGLVKNHIRTIPQGGLLNLVSPMHEGNLCSSCGPKDVIKDRWDLSTSKKSFDLMVYGANELVPSLSEKDIIATFVGNTVSNSRDAHIVEPSKKNPNFINVVLRMPGFTPSPLVAAWVVDLLGEQGLKLEEKTHFNPTRKGIPKFAELSNEEKDKLIEEDPRYGHVICRCETVTEGEIIEAIKRGATTVQGIQFRTRAAMGRCQSGFCGPKLIKILSDELGIPATEVTKKGGDSRILLYRSKELLKEA